MPDKLRELQELFMVEATADELCSVAHDLGGEKDIWLGDRATEAEIKITALKLDADWVILSACNTAAGGAEGAEAYSGLARAFFYAGARTLLVSHWAVAPERP
jgi:CHAT domain-containing protein